MSHVLASLDKTVSSKKVDTKIIEFGWAVLIVSLYGHFLKYSHLQFRELRVDENCLLRSFIHC